MATFKNAFAKDITTSEGSASTVLTGTTNGSIVIGMTVANTSTSPITCSVFITSSAVNYYLIKDAPIAVGGAFVPIGGDQKVVLENNDVLKAFASAATSATVTVSYMDY